MSKLSPCPWCGGVKALEFIWVTPGCVWDGGHIVCNKCQVGGPIEYGDQEHESTIKKDAITAWNNRKGETLRWVIPAHTAGRVRA